jgi:diacylglycerol O-acyltransferase / wax synthase
VPDDRGAHIPRARIRPAWWGEVGVLIGLLWVYDAVRSLAPARVSHAVATGRDLLGLEQRWHLDIERGLNQALVHSGLLAQYAANYYYAVLHFGLTLGLLCWVYWRHPEQYRSLRRLLVMINLIALVTFWLLPLAPPRLLPGAGFVDTVAAGHTIGSWGSPATADANFYAAMPSLHAAWALWVTVAVSRIGTRPATRWAAAAHPAVTGLVVLATANHYVLDTVAGVLTVGVAAVLTRGPSLRSMMASEHP